MRAGCENSRVQRFSAVAAWLCAGDCAYFLRWAQSCGGAPKKPHVASLLKSEKGGSTAERLKMVRFHIKFHEEFAQHVVLTHFDRRPQNQYTLHQFEWKIHQNLTDTLELWRFR